MAIATKCTCGHSLTGVCTSSVKECRQLKKENTQLPKEVVEQIKTNAALRCDRDNGKDDNSFRNGYYSGYVSGATAYATKLHQAEETIKELERWKQGAITLLSKIDQYADKHPEIKLGMGKVEFTIERAKKFDAAKAQPGARWVKCWEHKPDTHKVRFKDKHGNEFIGNYSKDTGQYWAYGIGQAINDVIYWRPQNESAAGREDAVEFAEWLYQNRWFRFENGRWEYTFEQGSSVSRGEYLKNYIKTTADLYTIFKQKKEK